MPSKARPEPPSSFVALADASARRVLDEALGRLSPVQRQVFLVRMRSESDPERIGARLGLSRDAARASLAFAVAQLRMALSDAPLDKGRDDWLQRCRSLLAIAAAPVATAPQEEVDLPGFGVVVDCAPPPAPPVPAPEPFAFVVETRSTLAEHVTTAHDEPVRVMLPGIDVARPSAVSEPRPASSVAPVRRHSRTAHGRPWPMLALGFLAVLAFGTWAWHARAPGSSREAAKLDQEPLRVPPLSAPEAPLTASDFRLVLERQVHEGVLDDLDFFIWLAEQDAGK